ncbi:MAG: hypothetical protein GXP14_07485 [Gammaproteobacteria bacterium]|nr:hypothetical protein [Gammaproteobacteria bacterium]
MSNEALEEKLDVEENLETEEKKEQEGYMEHEQWIAAGKDPEKFRGRKAFDDHGESIQTIKDLKNQFSRFSETVGELKATYEQDANRRVEQARTEIQAEIEKAREDEDIQAFEAAKNKLDGLKQTEQTVRPLGIIQEFLSKNPVLDANSDQFDSNLYGTWAKTHDATLDSILSGDRNKQNTLTEDEISRSMNGAMQTAKGLYPEKFTSSRNSRQQAPTGGTKKPTQSVDYRSRLKDIPSNIMNSRDTTANIDMYDLLLKKGSKKDADDYAKAVLGDK